MAFIFLSDDHLKGLYSSYALKLASRALHVDLHNTNRLFCSLQVGGCVPPDQVLFLSLEGHEPRLCPRQEARHHHHGWSVRRRRQGRRPEGRTPQPQRAARVHVESGPRQLQGTYTTIITIIIHDNKDLSRPIIKSE